MQKIEHRTLTPHQHRVIAERLELVEKIEKLEAFMDGPQFALIPEAEHERLRLQQKYMRLYAAVLSERIEAF